MMDKIRLIGIEHTSFTGNDGTPVTGTTLYGTEGIDPKKGQGEKIFRCFLSTAKFSALDFKPTLGQTLGIVYNRYGKVDTLTLVDDGTVIE